MKDVSTYANIEERKLKKTNINDFFKFQTYLEPSQSKIREKDHHRTDISSNLNPKRKITNKKINSSMKIRNEIREIYNHIYNKSNRNNEIKKCYINQYINLNTFNKPLRHKAIKLNILKHNDYFTNQINKNFNNTIDKSGNTISEDKKIKVFHTSGDKMEKIKFGYENYACNTTLFNHTKLYKLRNINTKKFPFIGTPNKLRIKNANIFLKSIPYIDTEYKMKENYYNYYIQKRILRNKNI